MVQRKASNLQEIFQTQFNLSYLQSNGRQEAHVTEGSLKALTIHDDFRAIENTELEGTMGITTPSAGHHVLHFKMLSASYLITL